MFSCLHFTSLAKNTFLPKLLLPTKFMGVGLNSSIYYFLFLPRSLSQVHLWNLLITKTFIYLLFIGHMLKHISHLLSHLIFFRIQVFFLLHNMSLKTTLGHLPSSICSTRFRYLMNTLVHRSMKIEW